MTATPPADVSTPTGRASARRWFLAALGLSLAWVAFLIVLGMLSATGPGHRLLVPASALGGAVLLVVADAIARTAVPYADLPIGLLTSLVGGPFFFWLLRRARRTSGGWA